MKLIGFTQFDHLYASPNTLVYRAIREEDGCPVIVKVVNRDQPSPLEVAQTQREYDILKGIELDGVIRALGVFPYQRGLALVLEDFGAISLRDFMKQGPLTLWLILRIGVALSDTLGRLHQRGIIHRDITPDNILIRTSDGRIKLIDFRLSSLVPCGRQEWVNPERLEGTLPYIAPEQTGRMNRSIDHRADMYSLGITLYELLTGTLPFNTADALEQIHCHIAMMPEPVARRNSLVPPIVSEIVMRLLAKNPDDRYRSGFGLMHDLETCLAQLDRGGLAEPFALSTADCFTFFRIPDKLYGREKELRLLERLVEEAAGGGKALVMVSGAPGIGKTGLIRELETPARHHQCMIAEGKFDPFRHDKPYSALIDAFRGLARQVLGDSAKAVARWGQRLNECWGANGLLMTALIPELSLVAGSQGAVDDLPPVQAQNRFQHLFREFVKVFARPEHPLILFIDDLQWADPATCKLLELLLTDSELSHFLCIGAYRDQEIDAAHPLRFTLDALRQTGVTTEYLYLAPLAKAGVASLITEAFMLEQSLAEELAELVMARTMGNPFYLRLYLLHLHEEGLLLYDPAARGWIWKKKEGQVCPATENVIDLMCDTIERLSVAAQGVLGVAACIGNRFSLGMLALAWEKEVSTASAALEEVLRQGLILPLDESYKYAAMIGAEAAEAQFIFLHDRVQQTAYALMPAERIVALHHRIGMLIWQATPEDTLPDRLFTIVGHLNAGVSLVSGTDRTRLARLNLMAGRKAKMSAAYTEAVGYVVRAMDLLPGDAWENDYPLAMAIHFEAAECGYLAGNYHRAEELFELVFQHSRTALEKARVHRLRVVLYQNQGLYRQAMAEGRKGLGLLGYRLSESPGRVRVALEMVKIKTLLGRRRPEDLLHLPRLDDPEKKEAMALLVDITSAAYYTSREDYAMIVLAMVALSIRHGNLRGSATGYAAFGTILATVLADYEGGYAFVRMALALSRNLADQQSECASNFAMGGLAGHFRQPLKEMLVHAENAGRLGLAIGDFVYAGYGLGISMPILLALGRPLDEIHEVCRKNLVVMRKINHEDMLMVTMLSQQTVLALQGLTDSPWTLTGGDFDEDATLKRVLSERSRMVAAIYYTFKLFLAVVHGDFQEANRLVILLDAVGDSLIGQFQSVWINFLTSLTLAGLYDGADHIRRWRYRSRIAANQKQMRRLVANCPENFSQFYLLVAAEEARLKGQGFAALTLYQQAVRAARDNGFLHYEALTHELAARFAWNAGFATYAACHLREARYCYLRWGAKAKGNELEEKYPQVFEYPLSERIPITSTGASHASITSTTDSRTSQLDVQTVVKATQEISGEILVDRLLEKLMRIVLENAGAERGYLALVEKGQPVLRVSGTPEGVEVRLADAAPHATAEHLAMNVVRYTARTLETVVVADASHDKLFSADPHIVAQQVKSLLCLPVLRQGNLVGILYLENNLTSGAFTPARVQLLRILAGQLAISIDNASLYATLEDKVAERTEELKKALEEIRILSNTDPLTGIANRRFFFAQFEKELDRIRRYPCPLALLAIDIDYFKKINDTFGHQQGDLVLKKLVAVLNSVLRKTDILGRIGGEEFAVLLPETSYPQVEVVAEHLRAAVAAALFPKETGQEGLRVTISIGGCALNHPPYPDQDEIYVLADQALYQAKENGRNQTVCRQYGT